MSASVFSSTFAKKPLKLTKKFVTDTEKEGPDGAVESEAGDIGLNEPKDPDMPALLLP
jgi:hypothetical protein